MTKARSIISDLMVDFDDEKHAARYCEKMNCSACEETNESGSSGDFGCHGQDEYVNARYDSILKRRTKKLIKTLSR